MGWAGFWASPKILSPTRPSECDSVDICVHAILSLFANIEKNFKHTEASCVCVCVCVCVCEHISPSLRAP